MKLDIMCLLLAANHVAAIYDPNSGTDWTALKPASHSPEGSHSSLPFRFGLVVVPHKKNERGEYIEPTPSHVPRSTIKEITTSTVKTYTRISTTSAIVSIPKPVHTHDVVEQIKDGQIQKPERESDCENENESHDHSKAYYSLKKKNPKLYDDYCDDDQPIEDDCDDQPSDDDCDDQPSDDDCDDQPSDDDCDDSKFSYKRHEDGDDCNSDEEDFESPIWAVACTSETTLSMEINNGIITDALGRIGSIVSSRQFQFDGPMPQYGAIYASGWSVTKHGKLALGDCTTFFQCSSGDFYNLYDTCIAEQCQPVSFDVVEVINCQE